MSGCCSMTTIVYMCVDVCYSVLNVGVCDTDAGFLCDELFLSCLLVCVFV